MSELVLQGIAASPGIAMGKALVLPRPQASVNFRPLTSEQEVEAEKTRLLEAMEQTRKELLEVRQQMQEDLHEYTGIIDAHILMLDDKLLKQQSLKLIEEQKISSEWALSLTLAKAEERFQGIKDEYIRDRLRDVAAVIDHVMRHLSGHKQDTLEVREKVIMVVHDLSPADISRLDKDMIMGLAVEQGGPTSHVAIIARAMGIPAVLGLDKATLAAGNGDMAIIDGSQGEFIVRPTDETFKVLADRSLAYDLYLQEILALADQPAHTVDNIYVEVGANIELLEEVASVHNFGAESVGLYRTEFACLSYNRLPTEDEMFDNLAKLVCMLNGLPVIVRTLDVGGDKLAGFNEEIKEMNPNLGLRGIRYSLKHRDFFLNQLRAILRASSFGPVQIMFPLVASVEEVIEAKACLQEAKDSLRKRGMQFDQDIKVGLMMEVPSAVIVADLLADMVDFFSIGTNDLIQYSLAIDRDNEQVANLYQPLSTAVLRLIYQIAEAGRKAGIPVNMCGEMAGDARFTPLLLGLGVERLSMSPLVIPRIKEVVRQTNVANWRQVAEQAMRLPTAALVDELLEANLQKHMPQLFH